jgi:predicted PurR-regulated permease PerM
MDASPSALPATAAAVPAAAARSEAPPAPLAPGVCGLRSTLRRPVTAVNTIAIVAALAAAWIGAAFWVPMVAAITLAVLLWPALRFIERWLRVRVLSALLVVSAAVAVTLMTMFLLAAQLSVAGERVPDVLRLAARDLQSLPQTGTGTVQRTQQALDELDRAVAKVTGTARATGSGAAKPNSSIVAAVVAWSSGFLAAAGRATTGVLLQAGAIVLLTFFLLCSGDRLARMVSVWCDGRPRVRLPRGSFSPLVQDLAREMRQFGAVTLITNAVIAMAVGLGFAAFGVEDAWAWGLAAGALHFVPYAGLALTMVLAAVEVYATQASAFAALLAVLYIAAVGVAVGSGLAAWLQGRASRVDSAITFGGTVFFSVLWGGWGLVLGPLLVVTGHAVWRHIARQDATAAVAGPQAPAGAPVSMAPTRTPNLS